MSPQILDIFQTRERIHTHKSGLFVALLMSMKRDLTRQIWVSV